MKKTTLLFFVFCSIVATMEAQFIQPNSSLHGSKSVGVENEKQQTAPIKELLARLHSSENQAGLDQQQFNSAERQVLSAYLRGQNTSNRAPQATLLEEGFDDITTLPGAGFTFVNASDSPGTSEWFQGNDLVFPSQTGGPTAYIGANFNSTAGSVINNFMITPVLNLENGDEITFWTRTTDVGPDLFPDRLEVRISPDGANVDPAGPSDVGSYTELLLEINPALGDDYPHGWTEFTATVSGLTGAIDTRVAFRYWVTDGGPVGSNSDYIGIDTLTIEEAGGGSGGVSTVYAKDGTAICTGGDFGSFPLDGPYNLNTVNNDPAANFAGDFDGSGTLYTMDNDNLTLLTIDPATGISTTVGPLTNIVAGHGTRGLAWNEANSTMYLLSGLGDDVTLYTVDLSSGTLTEIGTTTIAGFVGIWLAIDNDGNAYMADIGLDNLYSMDLATGTATEIGPLGIDISFAQDADFDPETGILYMGAYIGGGVNQWASVDTATGAATGLGPVNADCAELTIVAIEGAGTPPPPNCTSTAYDATAVPFDIDGADTSTADCGNAPNEIPITVTDIGTIGDGATLENITIDIAHTFSGDLDISLVSPAGTELVLAQDLGGGTDDAYNGTMFEDGGADISGATAPFGVGPYMAVGGTFADTFDGESVSGDWILKVCDDAGGDTGQVLQFSMSICVPPTNDECENAYALSCGDTFTGETTSDTDSGGNTAPDEFFSYTGSGNTELVTISLCGGGTDFDTVLRVYDSCDLTTIVAENDDSCGLQSEVTFVSDGSTEYLIMVEGFDSNSGNFELNVTCEEPLENDFCEGALPIACGETITGSTDGATPDTGAPECSGVSITAPGVWYTFTDDSGLVTDYTVSLCDSDYDTKLSVYSGDCGTLVCEAGNDDSCGSDGLKSEASFQGDGNTTYYILVHGFGGATGNYSLNVDCLPVPPPNDMIANSIDVDEIGIPYTDPAVPMPAATTEGGNPNGCNIDGANGVWYNFVANEDGEATASITSPAGASVVTFFEAPDENASETDLTLVNQGTNQCLPGTSTTINTTAGQAYYVFVVNTGGTTDITIDGIGLGTEDNAIEGFSYYPNPADDMISLRAMDTIENVAIYSILGQKVMDQTIGNVSTELNISALSTGTYIMKVSVNGEIGTYKVIKR